MTPPTQSLMELEHSMHPLSAMSNTTEKNILLFQLIIVGPREQFKFLTLRQNKG